jgi:hypothetical protein
MTSLDDKDDMFHSKLPKIPFQEAPYIGVP